MNTEKILQALAGEDSTLDERKVAAYIAWQLSHMSNRELTEKTAEEIEKGKFNKADLWDNIHEAAMAMADKRKSLCVDDSVVYGWAREYLSIDGAVSEAETKGFSFCENEIPEPIPEIPTQGENELVDSLFDF